jgi:2-polyprenyl-6-methoxyphenol hydroxylase-like FAD-dependent oxidoreductase
LTPAGSLPAADFDALIIGAGPAGAALAIALSRPPMRWRVALVERRAAHAETAPEHAGQTLPGAARRLLVALGVWHGFVEDAHPASLGQLSCWGQAQPERRDAFVDPQGGAWRIYRARFEQRLLTEAQAQGCTLLQPARVSGFARDAAGADAWQVQLAPSRTLRCRWLVDASGRRATIARQLGARVMHLDRLVCDLLRLEPIDGHAHDTNDLDGFSLVEARPDGWCYGSALPASGAMPGGRLVACYSDPAPGTRGPRDAAALLAALQGQPLMGRFVQHHRAAGLLRRRAAGSASLCPPAGTGWAAVGDAAASFDPLSSQGLFHALYSALRLADALQHGTLPAYSRELAAVWQAYRRHRQAYYATETRWPATPFWASRRSPDSGLLGLDLV